MLQFSNEKSSGTSISTLIKFVLLISIFIAVPPYLFAQNTINQDIEKYKNCLGREYGKLDVAVKKLKDLMQANNEKLETYIPPKKFKDENFEKLCKVPGLSKWVKPFCITYNLGQGYNTFIATKQSNIVNGVYRQWLKNNSKECYKPPKLRKFKLPMIYGADGIKEKDIKLIHSLMKKGRDKYCIKINKTTDTIKELKEKCSIVPNITGKCLDEARRALLNVYLFPKMNVEGIKSDDESRWKIYKQSPVAGILLKNMSSKVNVSIQNTIVNIKTEPDVWLDANPGGFKQLKATAYFKCNTTTSSLDLIKKKAGDWKSSNHNIATVQNGKITISKKAKNGQEATITVTYPDKGPLKTRKSKQIKVKVKTESNLKEIVLKPQGSTLLKSLDPPKEIKAFAIFSDGSKKEITKAKEITWKANQSSINFYKKGEMTIRVICWKSFKVTIDYQYKGKTYQSKPLVYKIHPDYTYVPWVIKEQKAKAINMLKKNQLIPKVQEYAAFDKHYKINEVIFQDPLYCVIVKKGSKVVLTINPDPAKNKIKVPDLFGKNFSETNSIITKLGLSLQVKYFSSYNEKFKPETVVTQNPKKGTLVLSGAWITVTLNRKSKKIEMPNLLCMTEQQARSILAPLNLRLSATVASSYDTQCKKGEIIEQSPRKGETVLRGSTVKVLINPSSKPLIGIKIKPEEKRSYPLNTKLTLIENVTLETKGNTYRFKWYHNNKLVSTERSYTHTYKKPGQHTIRLDMISSDSRENDTIRTSIGIEYPTIQEAECNVDFEPKKIKYKEGDRVTFVASGRNLGGVTEYQWYVNGRKVGSGTSFTYTFKNQGTYTVKLGLRMGSNFDEKTCQKSIVIGSGLRPAGERNHFTDKGGLNNLSIYSKYWMGGFGKWSNYSKFRKIGSVDGYRLCTGAQADLFNAGFLVYKKKGSDKLSFEVYHFHFGRKSGIVHYSGNIPKSHNPRPESITTQCHQNMVEVSWINEDGSECNTKIWKYRYSSLLAHYGVDEPTCTKPIISSNKLKRCKKFAKTALKQYEENIKRQCNLFGPEWHDDEERHKNWCLNVSKREADDLTKNRENALKRCGKTWCDTYAKLAIEQNEKNILYGCGYKGMRWQSNYGNHLGWCQSVSKKASGAETKKREQLLQRCIGVSKGVCSKYAEKALEQNKENLRRECGFCGVRWQSNYDDHLQWCLKHKDMRNFEEKARAELLRSKCPSVHRGERTFYEPCFNGYRLDNCLNYGRNCVKPAADKFCESKGYAKARNQELQKARPTYIMDDNRICDADYCAGFKYITCSGYTNPANKNPECRIKEPKSGMVVQPGKYVHFKAEASDEDKDRLKYNWKFEGGSPAKWESEQTSSITTHWRNPGIYTATLTVTDKKGGSCTDSVTVQAKPSVSHNGSAHEPNGSAPDISGTWKWFDGETIHIYPNGTATDRFKGKWKANWNGSRFTYTINWNNGQYIDSLVLHGDTLDGHNQNGTHVWGKRILPGRQISGGSSGDTPFGTANFNEFSLKGNIYYLQANTSRLPDFGAMSPVGSIYTKKLNISNRSFTSGFPGVTNRFEWFGIRYSGTFQIQQGGQHTFRLSSDDGSKLWIDNQLIVNNDGIHPNRSKSGTIYLNPGQHNIQVDYFQGPRTMLGLQLFVTPPGGTEKIFSPKYGSNQKFVPSGSAQTATLRSGTYQVEQGRYKSTWKIRVSNGRISGTSEWSCCPKHRVDPVRGTISGNSVVIERDCSGKGWNGACRQTYRGTIKGKRITGSCMGTGLTAGATWVLYLDGGNSHNTAINGNATPQSPVDITGKWKWFNGAIVTIDKYGKVSGSNGGKGKVSVNSSNNIKYVIKWNNRYTDNLKLHGNTLDGHNQNGTHVWGKRIILGNNNNYTNENVWTLNAANNIFKWNGKNWDVYAGKAQDIGVGANGSVWIMDTERHRYGGSIYRLEGSNFIKTSGQGVRIDVDPYGNPWVINNLSNIYKWQNNAWHRMPGSAKDIGIGANGDVWIIGTDASNGNYGIYKWSGSQWVKFPGAAVRIDVGPRGAPWVVNAVGNIYRWDNHKWIKMPGKAKDISVSSSGTAWVIGTDNTMRGHSIFKWNGSKWIKIPGAATVISVGGKK